MFKQEKQTQNTTSKPKYKNNNDDETDSTAKFKRNTKTVKPSHKLKRMLAKHVNRGKIVYGILDTMAGGYRAVNKLNAWKEPPREVLPKYIQTFCRKMGEAFNVTVVAVEPVPQTHALWASNHISWMDIPVVGSISPAFFLSKADVADMPLFGFLAKACGTLFIHRGSGDSGSMALQMAEFLKKGYSIIFFPEATTTDGKAIKKLYGKLLQSAIDANIPVQPIVICYVNSQGQLDDQVPFCGGLSLKESILQVMDSEPVTAYVLPLEPLLPTGNDREALTKVLQERMQTGLEDLHHRVLKQPVL